MASVVLYQGDMREVLSGICADSVDSVVTDPPYHLTSIVKRFQNGEPAHTKTAQDIAARRTPIARLASGFMGKKWDGGDVAFDPATWAEVWRVLKPGGHLVAMGGTRTYHRMVCAVEDAGFEIRDTLAFMYGVGFPKSHNLDKHKGKLFCACETEQVPERNVRPLRDFDLSKKIPTQEAEGKILQPDLPQPSISADWAQTRDEGIQTSLRPNQSELEGWSNLSTTEGALRLNKICSMPSGVQTDVQEGWLCDGASVGNGQEDQEGIVADRVCTSSGSQPTQQLSEQFGTVALQPQPQVCGTWGHCGRCGKPIIYPGLGTALKPAMELIVLARKPLSEATVAANVLRWGVGAINVDACRVPPGRWPANVLHDGGEEVEEGLGAAMRFFYSAKAGKGDRAGSKHPTVKPVALMRWLVRLVTPPGGLVLDPFAGSGTTGQAAREEGMGALLIEREGEYIEDIKRRLAVSSFSAERLGKEETWD